ncbi:MAG TPA: hypothetical protein VFR90_10665 [Methylibium sp.]|uniref:hypothetical protein n=1 Tax=Methylibium sp. TaxID=2067992 RepID=UPI002DC04C18|nr:hypothetical protein [Methylibium sp.]HEU4459575.1 hypothetical protein [Methylibium sp.]
MSESNLEKSIFGDMANLEKSLTEDHSGDKARAMIDYFKVVAEASDQRVGVTEDPNDRKLIQELAQGFRASQRIIAHVWETAHGTVLVH